MTMPSNSNLERNVGVAILLLLIAGCLFVLRPFVSMLLWGVVLCASSWPLYRRLLRLVNQRHTLAASLMTLGLLLIVLFPFVIVGMTLADNVNALTAAVQNWMAAGPPAPPEWLGKIPVVGAKAVESWLSLAGDSTKLMAKAQEEIPVVSGWLLKAGLLLGNGLLGLALSIFIAFFLFRDGEAMAGWLNAAVGRIAGGQGVRLLTVANKTIRGVVYGILGTALAQAVLAGIGYVIAGVPGAALLALLTFFASVIPVVGVGLVWIPAAIWLFHQGSTGYGIFMIVWGLFVGNVDNFIKPWLISQGSNLPFILIFFGVIGGALAFGFIGVFLGPTLLAVGYRLIEEWNPAGNATAKPEPAPK
ncbi:MAG TPA: AI-2E family transporter [Candidatus Acidoferrum sp.]|nr:AI-2E family transporter [Candidatus Acidoferrum sp.]